MEKKSVRTANANIRTVAGDSPAKNDSLVRPLDMEETTANSSIKHIIVGVYVLLVLFGISTGFLMSKTRASSVIVSAPAANKPQFIKTDKIAGISDNRTFRDQAVGTIEKGGLAAEGTHKLLRDGGPSQTVYLISSVVDLDEYEGKKVTVWGETVAGKKVAWLMDVGRVETQ